MSALYSSSRLSRITSDYSYEETRCAMLEKSPSPTLTRDKGLIELIRVNFVGLKYPDTNIFGSPAQLKSLKFEVKPLKVCHEKFSCLFSGFFF